jgi:ubiquinone/menaquinone biosynthesis C-methylase UbiE
MSREAGTEARERWQRYWADRENIEEVYSNEGRIIRELMPLVRGQAARVLEVGAGSGRDSVELAGAGASVVVLDYVPSSLETARRVALSAGSEVFLVCGDANNMPLKSECFDVVFHQGLMEHFRDPKPLLAENRRVLKKGGHLLVDVPQKYHIYTVVKHVLIVLRKWFAGWETEYTISGLERLVTKSGFRIVRSYGDWMVPGFFYRSLRYVLARSGLAVLPKYPCGLGPGRRLGEAMRMWFRRRRLAFYTYHVIGTLARRV